MPDISSVERAKYEQTWTLPAYRKVSPGANVALSAIEAMDWKPPADIIDIGCGTGRASLIFDDKGFNVFAVDTASNAMGQDTSHIHLHQMCLFTDNLKDMITTDHLPELAIHGFCCDVMEHIPPEQVGVVLMNIREACDDAFFGIAHFADAGWGTGALHLTIASPEWWRMKLSEYFAEVEQVEVAGGRSFETTYWKCSHG